MKYLDYNWIEQRIGYEFKNKELLRQAFVHSSYAHEENIRDNDRMEFFGDAIWEAMNESAASARHTPGRSNLLELLPDEFTYRDAMQVRQSVGMNEKGTRNMLCQWAHRNYVLQMTNDNYKKLKFRSDGIDLTKNSKG